MTTRVTKSLTTVAAMAAAGLVLAACSPPNEQESDQPGTTPAVITGDQAPQGNDGRFGADTEGESLSAELIDTSGDSVGEATFESAGNGVRITVSLTGGDLEPGFHGMHLHETAQCDPGGETAFSSAGGHLSPDADAQHGVPGHGDLVSLQVLEDGTGETVTVNDAITLDELAGAAIIIHEDPDNYANIPTRYAPAPDEDTLMTGDSGGRLVCGAIEEGDAE